MPANRNALIRYKTIDNCLRNRYRRWTLENLIEACSQALYEYEGISKGVSRRTVQLDIQFMRSEKLGYNAPIVVYENKYYTYEDPNYSITHIPLTDQDLSTLSEAVEVLKQFSGFSQFSGMSGIVSRLEDQVFATKQKTIPVIDFEKNENLKGLNYLESLYQAIIKKQVVQLRYRSFKARTSNTFYFHPYLLKEYRNRWFVFGIRTLKGNLQNLALDRIEEIHTVSQVKYIDNTSFDPLTFFNDMIGVTKNPGNNPETIHFQVSNEHAPYILTKPIHSSQRLLETLPDHSMVFEIRIIPNPEFIREILGYADGIKILSPNHLIRTIRNKFRKAAENYNS